MAAREELIEVLTLAREALAHPDNDFAWSSWADIPAALAEVDRHIATLKAGGAVPRLDLDILFAATGNVQEVALSSGWADAYLRLAERFDAAHLRFQTAIPTSNHPASRPLQGRADHGGNSVSADPFAMSASHP